MHPRTREVRRPASGIDPRGSGTGQPPLLQGFLKHRKPGVAPKAPAPEAATAAAAPPDVPAPEVPAPEARPAGKAAGAAAAAAPKARKRAAPKA